MRAFAPGARTMEIPSPILAPVHFPVPVRLYVGIGGTLVIRAARDPMWTKTPFKNVWDSEFLFVRVRTLWPDADGTTAADIVATW
jgi:hypothetical protein